MIDFRIKTVIALKMISSSGFCVDSVRIIDTSDELAAVEKCLRRGAWEEPDWRGWLKYSPSTPAHNVLLLYGKDGQGAIIHLYSSLESEKQRGATSLAMFNEMPAADDFDAGMVSPSIPYRGEFNRYWVEMDVYKQLYALTAQA